MELGALSQEVRLLVGAQEMCSVLIEGADVVVQWARAKTLTGVVAIDDRTLKVRLIKPTRRFARHCLADPVASVLKRANVELWPVEYYNSGMTISGVAKVDAREFASWNRAFQTSRLPRSISIKSLHHRTQSTLLGRTCLP